MKCLVCNCEVDSLKNEIHTSLYHCIAALSKRLTRVEVRQDASIRGDAPTVVRPRYTMIKRKPK